MTATRDLDIDSLLRKSPDGESAWGERKIVLSVDGLTGNRIQASFSSESPASQKFGNEVLLHGEGDIDLSRVKDGGRLPLLKFHDQKQWPIGFIEGFRLDPKDKKTRGTVVFAEDDEDAAKALSLYRQGVPLDLSIGYDRDYETARYDPKANTFYFRWKPAEVSVLPMGADTRIGFGRSKTEPSILNPGHRPEVIMSDDNTPVAGTSEVSPASVIDIGATKRAHNMAKKAGAAEAIAGERQRIADIHELFDLAIVPRTDFYVGLRARAVDEGWPLDGARNILMQAMSGEAEPAADWNTVTDTAAVRVATHQGQLPPVVLPDRGQRQRLGGSIQQGTDERDKFADGVTHGLLVRAGVLESRDDIAKAREGGVVGKSLRTLSGDFCRMVGIATASLSDEDLAGRALSYRTASGQTTSDFTNILANVANKALLRGWDEAPETWNVWTRRGTLPDFKRAEISGISGFTGLDEVPEDGDISYGKFTDRKETIQLVSYGKKYRMSRKLIINDDLNALGTVPRAMGRAANRKVGDIVYAVLEGTGPTLNQDSLALFHTATHKNYVVATTAPTVATLNTAETAMALQTDPNTGKALNIKPRYLLVPVTLSNTARVLMAATYDPAGTAGTLPPNPFSGRFEVVSDARLDGQTYGTLAWYLLADPNIFDTVEVSFLNGMAEPYMRENQEWDGQGISYMIGVDFGVAALDWRGMHKYKGNGS